MGKDGKDDDCDEEIEIVQPNGEDTQGEHIDGNTSDYEEGELAGVDGSGGGSGDGNVPTKSGGGGGDVSASTTYSTGGLVDGNGGKAGGGGSEKSGSAGRGERRKEMRKKFDKGSAGPDHDHNDIGGATRISNQGRSSSGGGGPNQDSQEGNETVGGGGGGGPDEAQGTDYHTTRSNNTSVSDGDLVGDGSGDGKVPTKSGGGGGEEVVCWEDTAGAVSEAPVGGNGGDRWLDMGLSVDGSGGGSGDGKVPTKSGDGGGARRVGKLYAGKVGDGNGGEPKVVIEGIDSGSGGGSGDGKVPTKSGDGGGPGEPAGDVRSQGEWGDINQDSKTNAIGYQGHLVDNTGTQSVRGEDGLTPDGGGSTSAAHEAAHVVQQRGGGEDPMTNTIGLDGKKMIYEVVDVAVGGGGGSGDGNVPTKSGHGEGSRFTRSYPRGGGGKGPGIVRKGVGKTLGLAKTMIMTAVLISVAGAGVDVYQTYNDAIAIDLEEHITDADFELSEDKSEISGSVGFDIPQMGTFEKSIIASVHITVLESNPTTDGDYEFEYTLGSGEHFYDFTLDDLDPVTVEKIEAGEPLDIEYSGKISVTYLGVEIPSVTMDIPLTTTIVETA